MKEALKLALEALEAITRRNQSDHQAEIAEDAITAIKAALEAKDEPEINLDHVICPNCVHQFRAIPKNVQRLMLDASFEPPFTTPPQRIWVGLTDEEIEELRLKTFDAIATNYEVYRVIEAKLKEKNT